MTEASEGLNLNWGVERRLEFIEFRLFWEGGVNRADIMEMFAVSMPQASKDLSLYQEIAPENALYDKSAKRYVASDAFRPHFLKPDSDTYLSRLRLLADGFVEQSESWIRTPPAIDIALTPHRGVSPAALRSVLDAIRDGGSIEARYQSMNKSRPGPIWRRITPHALGYDGFRWHARAYCHLDNGFQDFLLPRIIDARLPGPAGAAATNDVLWQTTFEVVIGPHPSLTSGQQEIVSKDYGMRDGRLRLKVRYAMLFYVLKRLGLLEDAKLKDSRHQHIVVLNWKDTREALKRVDFEVDSPSPGEERNARAR